MDKNELAERLLAMACGRQRATEVVGDLLEMNANAITFWWAVTQVIWGISCRWLFGVLAAAGSSFGLMVLLSKFMPKFGSSPSPHTALSSVLMTSSICLAGVLVINMFRFGARDEVTTSGATLVGFLIAASCASTARQTNLLLAVLGVFAVYASLNLRRIILRRSMMVFIGAALGYTGAFDLLMQFWPKDPSSTTPRVLIVGIFAGWLTSICCGAWVLSEMRRFALPSRSN